MKEKNKGITLIALIITVIIMLILTGVSISLALNSGLFKKAGEGTQKWQAAQEKESEVGSGKVDVGGTEYNSVDEYLASLNNGTTTTVPWLYQENADGNIEITGIDLTKYCGTELSVDGYGYCTYATLGSEKLVVPNQINGKNVVKFSLSGSILPTIADLYIVKIADVKTIIFGNNIVQIDNIEQVPIRFINQVTIEFPNDINETLEIPANKWGATSVKINGVKYLPLSWLYQENEEGNIEITGIDLSNYTLIGSTYRGYAIDFAGETLVIPAKILGKDVVKVELSCIIAGGANHSNYHIKFSNLSEIVIGNNAAEIDLKGGTSVVLVSSTVINFPDGKNEALVIPNDKWGVNTIMISGVEYVPGT